MPVNWLIAARNLEPILDAAGVTEKVGFDHAQ